MSTVRTIAKITAAADVIGDDTRRPSAAILADMLAAARDTVTAAFLLGRKVAELQDNYGTTPDSDGIKWTDVKITEYLASEGVKNPQTGEAYGKSYIGKVAEAARAYDAARSRGIDDADAQAIGRKVVRLSPGNGRKVTEAIRTSKARKPATVAAAATRKVAELTPAPKPKSTPKPRAPKPGDGKSGDASPLAELLRLAGEARDEAARLAHSGETVPHVWTKDAEHIGHAIDALRAEWAKVIVDPA